MLYDFNMLSGTQVSLVRFDKTCITPEYLSWLNDQKVMRFSNQRFLKHTKYTSLAYLDTFTDSSNLFLAIRMRDNLQMVGTITAYVSENHATADIGLMIGDQKHWGRGIGLDAWRTLMNYLLMELGMRKVTGGTLRCNVGMIRIMERSGMHLEAVRVKQQIVEGDAQDELYYSKFRN